MTSSILDLFAGPGGWSTGLRILGIDTARDEVGVEWDAHAAATARKAGHRRLVADVAALDYTGRTFTGVIASPPCQGFSMAGKGKGRADSLLLIEALRRIPIGSEQDVRIVLDLLHRKMTDDRSLLALEPLRAVLATMPEWTCWEQVPAVLPLWEACADVLRAVGYDVETGNVQAEQFGVPQTRKRAILRAVRGRRLRPLAPTHSRYHQRDPKRLDEGVLPWVSMAGALGGAMTNEAEAYVNGNQANSARRPVWAPAPTVHFGARMNLVTWQLRSSAMTNATVRSVDQPAPTITAGYRKAGDPPRQKTPGSVRVTVQEAAVLQSFPADYPWQGTKTAQYRQVGDAVPPMLAAAIVASVLPTDQEADPS